MKMGYKVRQIGTDKNDWIIAVIYDLSGWPVRSLKHQGLIDPQFVREATEIEKNDHERSGSTRCYYAKYKNIEGFIEDEKLCGVPEEFINKVCRFYTDQIFNLK